MNETEVESQKVFDWEAAFAELERKRRKKAEQDGVVYVPPSPPEVTSIDIDETGLVTIHFSEVMQEIIDLQGLKVA